MTFSPSGTEAGLYSLSAHGSSSFGVLRSAMQDSGYARGHCGHCHEQHASVDGTQPSPSAFNPSGFGLFTDTFDKTVTAPPYDQSDVFCFYCHCALGDTYQEGAGSEMLNYDFSRTFGGYAGGPESIMEAFNQPFDPSSRSSHNLLGVQEYAAANFSSWFTSDSDPCTACHNPHIGRRNKYNIQDAGYATISRPTDHQTHWGDELDEQMSDYASNYRAPYYYNSTTTYEPGGAAVSSGELIPDYPTFCLDCHGLTAALINSRNLSRQLKRKIGRAHV